MHLGCLVFAAKGRVQLRKKFFILLRETFFSLVNHTGPENGDGNNGVCDTGGDGSVDEKGLNISRTVQIVTDIPPCSVDIISSPAASGGLQCTDINTGSKGSDTIALVDNTNDEYSQVSSDMLVHVRAALMKASRSSRPEGSLESSLEDAELEMEGVVFFEDIASYCVAFFAESHTITHDTFPPVEELNIRGTRVSNGSTTVDIMKRAHLVRLLTFCLQTLVDLNCQVKMGIFFVTIGGKSVFECVITLLGLRPTRTTPGCDGINIRGGNSSVTGVVSLFLAALKYDIHFNRLNINERFIHTLPLCLCTA